MFTFCQADYIKPGSCLVFIRNIVFNAVRIAAEGLTMDLETAIHRQIAENMHLNLLSQDMEELAQINGSFILCLRKLIESPPDEMEKERIIRRTVRTTLYVLHRVNQFLIIPADEEKKLYRIYSAGWENFLLMDEKDAMRLHFQALSRWLEQCMPESFRAALRGQGKTGSVVNESYKPEWQLELFGLQPRELPEPLIDVGCGPRGLLPRYLRGEGIEAFGLDRYIFEPAPFLREENWLEFDFKPEAWGCIISNLGFSNHACYVKKHQPDHLENYRILYRSLLASLKPGGMLLYAPEIPFFEGEPDSAVYSLVRLPAPGGGRAVRITRKLNPLTGDRQNS